MNPAAFHDHPEGGRFAEVFKSAQTVVVADGRQRHALSHIYFSLKAGEVSRFHRVISDEVWSLYRGRGLRLYIWDEKPKKLEIAELSTLSGDFCQVVPAGCWQAARPLDDEVLVGCSVAPGFEYEDFELLDPDAAPAAELLALDPKLADLMVPAASAIVRQP